MVYIYIERTRIVNVLTTCNLQLLSIFERRESMIKQKLIFFNKLEDLVFFSKKKYWILLRRFHLKYWFNVVMLTMSTFSCANLNEKLPKVIKLIIDNNLFITIKWAHLPRSLGKQQQNTILEDTGMTMKKTNWMINSVKNCLLPEKNILK